MEETKELDKVQPEKVTLKLYGKEREIKFGFSAWAKLEKEFGGLKNLTKLQEKIENEPFSVIPHLMYVGLLDKAAYTDETGKKYPEITEANILDIWAWRYSNDFRSFPESPLWFAPARKFWKKTGSGSNAAINEFPWSYLITETLLLGKTEEWFWESTPRLVMALIDQKKEIEKVNMKNQEIYIAMYVWGKDPDEIEETNSKKPIPGIDIPADASLVNRLM